jgi:predicted DNA-binding transcriptional regulator
MSRERGDNGQFVEKASRDDVLTVLVEHNEPMTGTEVGDTLGISNRSALDKLNMLHERGVIERKKVGGRSVVWWLSDTPSVQPDQSHRDPTDILGDLESFLDDREKPSTPSVEAVQEDYHARRHREQLERLANDGA